MFRLASRQLSARPPNKPPPSDRPNRPNPNRYCELTSWNVEIKCRQRELPLHRDDREPDQTQSSSVIEAPTGSVRHSDPPGGPNFEAQIFDLRALTNYTFQVRPLPRQPAGERPASARGRRLELSRLAGRIETKPFGAAATKCLADSSEVLVNTGRFFGGRISVEDAADPRCQLLGNKTSEQAAYAFRIDHQLCGSRVMVSHPHPARSTPATPRPR